MTNENLERAMEVGTHWQRQLKYFQHVTCDHPLKNEYLFYRWQETRKISRKSSLNRSLDTLTVDEPQELNWLEFLNFQSFLDVVDPAVVLYNMLESSSCITTKSRTYRTKTYPNCWTGKQNVVTSRVALTDVGTDAVSWMEDKLLISRPEAVQLGAFIMQHNYFRHVCDAREFFDKEFFYTTRKCVKSYDGAQQSLVFKRSLHDILHDNYSLYHRVTLKVDSTRSVKPAYIDVKYNESLHVHIPPLVQFCVEELRKPECMELGIFRLSSQEFIIERLLVLIGCSTDGGLTVLKAIRGNNLPILFAQLLKQFLANLNDSLLSSAHREIWLNWKQLLQSNEISKFDIKLKPSEPNHCELCTNPLQVELRSTKDQVIDKMRTILFQLPAIEISVLREILQLLDLVQASHSSLDSKSLAKLFAPILFRMDDSAIAEYVKQSETITELIDFLILNQSSVFDATLNQE